MKFKILTYGCAMNKADSEFIAGMIKEKFDGDAKIKSYFVDEYKNFLNETIEHDFLIINTCVVKQTTENKILDLIRRINKTKGKTVKVIITGCLPAAYPEICAKFKFSFIGTNVIDIKEAIDHCLKSNVPFVKIRRQKDKMCIPKIPINPFTSIIPISEGCVGNCSYCATKLARQNLISYKEEKIVKSIKNLNNVAKEIYLTSQDTGCYGIDIGTNIVSLLEKISVMDGKFKVRVGMMNVTFALKFLDELTEIFKSEKFYRFIHIPVQSGSNDVLKDMKRNYTIENFLDVVKKFRSIDASISTDIITGFPTENEHNFKETVNLIKAIKPDFLNLSKFCVRKGTLAEKNIKRRIWKFDTKIAKERSTLISKIFNEISMNNNKKMMDWKGEVLITEREGGFLIGRNFAYKKIHIKDENKDLLGKFVNCKITSAGKVLEGKVLELGLTQIAL